MIRVVLDTNVVVSALLSKGLPSAVVTICLRMPAIEICLSEAIREEYRTVCGRPKFAAVQTEARRLIDALDDGALHVTPCRRVEKIGRDLPDNRVLECALSAQAHFLVTGNIRHFDFREFAGTRIVSPFEFLEVLITPSLQEGKGEERKGKGEERR